VPWSMTQLPAWIPPCKRSHIGFSWKW
jgi:hypothetical protein